ncbi:arginine deiminase family protein [Algoriphagus halophytocola]|uniref:arginine deiminase n=1 Tax=Algoriphagus halophytocola TaxID=2991499 RepID=A0ABY6MHW9_9BACT|nr:MULTISPECIES: arginine deiminase family protein [unclassified Algoriphagus]UZD22798.1 arginine deiminase family protein [Algoriphagus sp. TR-M5]WBL44064.1 arginine deiminase family protein [Algoriphagus sp. TR-M9]
MNLRLNSEFGTLKAVLMHRPGKEIDRLTPYNKEFLLFDDVPYLEALQREHDTFSNLIKDSTGAKVYQLRELLIRVLYDEQVLLHLMKDSLKRAGMVHLAESILERYSTAECAGILTAGLKVHELRRKLPNLNAGELMEFAFLISPCPNLYFQRDPMALTPGGIIFSSMRMEGRQREADLLRVIFENHPDFKSNIHTLYPVNSHDNPASIEGGDVIILSQKAVAIGNSERTDEKAIYHTAKALLGEGTVERVYEVHLPQKRQFMHLDTVFTVLDENLVLTYPDAMNAVLQTSLYTLKEIKEDKVHIKREVLKESLLTVLEREIPHLEILHTADGNPDYAMREQWFDGANVFAIGPRRVISYNRNIHTNRALREMGVEVLEIPSSELSRGLGGPRCMTMPISRSRV